MTSNERSAAASATSAAIDGSVGHSGAADTAGAADGAAPGGCGVNAPLDEQAADRSADQLPEETRLTLSTIFEAVKVSTGHDFSSYKLSTVMRRIERRMAVHALDRFESYAALLQENPGEADALSREILIGVTSFFRDPEAFAVVNREIIPRLFADRHNDEPVRIWHPCCATGEEVYSMAMLIREYLDARKLDVKVQFFATDLDAAAIAHARAGLYGDEMAAEVGEERLKRFFTRVDSRWQVSKQLRESIIFAQHSLIKDPPFSRLDLLVCRNFLIYITAETQKRLISLFHQVLKPSRYLFLGAAETTGNGSDLFAPLDKKWKIYQRLESGRREFSFPFTASFRRPPGAPRPSHRGEAQEVSPGVVAEKLLSERYAPPYVMVNQKYELVHISAGGDRFLRIPPGGPTRDLLRMAVEELRPALRAAIYKAFAENEQVVFRGVQWGDDAGSRVNVVVDPVCGVSSERLALVVFEPAPDPSGLTTAPAAGVDDTSRDLLVRQLEEQLRLTHEQLLAVTDQLETSHEGFLSANEELMSINEEFQSANEELQSTNEELETSKEELQALNEELVTVNAELHGKVEELNLANDDVENLLNSSAIATIFLDTELRIKRYTPAMAAVFNLIPADVGRAFTHFASAVDWSGLAADAASVLEKRLPVEREVTAARDGRHYLMRVLPYLNTGQQVNGVVVTLVDLTERKRMEDALLLAKEEWERTFNAVPDLIAIIDDQHRVVRANRAMAHRLGATPDSCVGSHCYRSVHCEEEPDRDCPHSRTLTDGREHLAEIYEERLGGYFLVTTTPLFDDSGCMAGSVHVARDITHRKEAEEELQRSKQQLEEQLAQLQAILDHLSDGVVIADLEGNLFHWNPAAVAMHGFSCMDDCRRKLPYFTEIFELSGEEGVLPVERWPLARILAGETLNGWELQVRRKSDDASYVFRYGGTLACDKSGKPILAVVSITDVTKEKRIQAALQENERRLGLALAAGEAAPWEVDLGTGRHSWDSRLFELLRVPRERQQDAEQLWSAFVLPDDRPRVEAEFEAACATGAEEYRSEFRARRMDGELHWYACRGRVVADPGGRRRMVGVLLEITERKNAEEMIRRHVEDLEANNLALSRFNEVSVGRELRMIELKKEINELCAGKGEPSRYPLAFEEQ